MTVFMLLVTETIPPTSEVIPLVAKFYMAAMFEIAMALVVTCYILRCYHFTGNEVPVWMKRYLVGKMANFLGIKKSKVLLEEEREKENIRKKAGCVESVMDKMDDLENGDGKKLEKGSRNGAVNEGNKKITDKLLDGYDGLIAIPRNGHQSSYEVTMEKPEESLFRELLSRTSDTDSCSKKRDDHIGHMMLEKLAIISDSVQAKEKVDTVKEQWHVIAMVIDRLAMWTFTVAIFITITIIFCKSPGYVP